MSSASDPPGRERPGSAGDDSLVRPVGDAPPDEGGPAPGAGEPDAAEPAGSESSGSESSGSASSSVEPLAPYESPAAARSRERQGSHNMLPGRERRRTGVERLLVRLIATGGILGIGVAIAAIMVSSKSQGWVVGLVVSIVTVVLAAVLWSSRQL